MHKQERAKYIMIGGFLGAGKSTSIARLAQALTEKGLRVGLITNDQGHGLVDTVNLRARGFAVEEIAGGCFCCRFHSLMDAADNLSRAERPDVFIAEPVGSCTDLIASVSYPLRRIYGDRFTIAPLSVVVDPRRAMTILGLKPGKNFSEKVTYIYLKQLEEASLIVVNKQELLSDQELALVVEGLSARFPQAEVMCCSARSGNGLDSWFAKILAQEELSQAAMPLDYQVYGEGEALLGWFNASVQMEADQLVDGDALLARIAKVVGAKLMSQEIEIAHFKMTLVPLDGSGELAALNWVGGCFQPELSQTLSDPLRQGELVINLRAEGSPENLQHAVENALSQWSVEGVHLAIVHKEAFRPGQPNPVYRMAFAAESPA